jgi:hypothetical protein
VPIDAALKPGLATLVRMAIPAVTNDPNLKGPPTEARLERIDELKARHQPKEAGNAS